jgi:hypothetical protein
MRGLSNGSGTRLRCTTRVGALGLVLLSSLGSAVVGAQTTPSAYARVAQDITERVAEALPTSLEERQRRAQIVARSGEATLTVGEIEYYLAHSAPSESTLFRTPDGQARIVRELLRVHLLARAAVARGAVSEATRFAARRAEDLALVRVYSEDLQRQTALRLRTEAANLPPAQHTNEQRYGVVFRGSRANAQRWIQEVASLPSDGALSLAQELGEGVETPWAERDATPLEGAERDALWNLAEPSAVSGPISIGAGRFAVVRLSSIQPGMEIGVGAEAQVYLASEEAVRTQVELLRAAHVTNYDSARVDGVMFRLPRELSRESMEAIATELEQTAAEVARAAAEASDEPPQPLEEAPPAEEPH